MGFRKAQKRRAKLRLLLVGLAGSGKTYTAIQIATALAGDRRVAVIDTERRSASLYADLWDYDVDDEMASFAPSEYIRRIQEAERAGYGAIVIDSISHAWTGTGGILEQVDGAQARGGNKMMAWADATPRHKALINAILQSRCHIVCTARGKTKWYLDEEETAGGKTKTTVRKGSLGAEQREGLDYEFSVVGVMRQEDHALIIDKSRCPDLADKIILDPGIEVPRVLGAWLDDGAEPEADRRKRIIAAIKESIDGGVAPIAINAWSDAELGKKAETTDELAAVLAAIEKGEI